MIYRDIKEFVWDDFKPITKNKSKEKYEDPLEDIYYYLKKAKRKYTAYSLTSQVEFYLKKNIYSPEASIAAYHILACVFVWNNDYEKAKNSHHYFLSNKEWYNENKVHIEDYMNFVLAMNNRDFIKELLQDYPFLKTDYSTMYNAYLDYFIYNNTRYKDCYYPYQIKMDLTNKLYSEN